MRPKLIGGRRIDACLRNCLLRLRVEEEGIALIMALGIMLVLTIALTTTLFFTASGARDAHRTNAGQQAYALAEAGINNAVAVLNANYPTTLYPGPTSWYGCNNLFPQTTTTYSSGSVTWSGCLVPNTNSPYYQWNLTAKGAVTNPTGPTAGAVTRTVTAVVPVVFPDTFSNGSGSSAINFIYGHNITFTNQTTIEAPIYATGNLDIQNKAVISETVPASSVSTAHPNQMAVVGNVTLEQNADSIGEWGGPNKGTYSQDPTSDQLQYVYIGGTCTTKQNTTPNHTCQEGDSGSSRDPIFAQNYITSGANAGTIPTTIPPGFISTPTMTCCDPITPGGVVTTQDNTNPSYMGFWYQFANLGPHSPCDPAKSAPYLPANNPVFDDGDNLMNDSQSQFNLTGNTYKCISYDGTAWLIWNGSTLSINGTIYYDGSMCAGTSGCGNNLNATYTGSGSILLSGSFTMTNGDNLCVGMSGGSCDPNVAWNPNNQSLGIIAYGDTGLNSGGSASNNGIEVKASGFQGLLMARENIYCSPASNTFIQGPMISVYGDVSCGQKNTLSFPPISFPSTGFSGSTGPFPPGVLSSPIQFGGG